MSKSLEACQLLGVRQNLPTYARQNLPTPATVPQPPRRSRERRYHPRRRRAAGSLLAYIPGLILARAPKCRLLFRLEAIPVFYPIATIALS